MSWGSSLPRSPPQKKTRPTNTFFSAGTVTKNRPLFARKVASTWWSTGKRRNNWRNLWMYFHIIKMPQVLWGWFRRLVECSFQEGMKGSLPKWHSTGWSFGYFWCRFHMNGICQDQHMKQVLLPIFHVGRLVSPNMTVPKPGNLSANLWWMTFFCSEDFRILKGDSGIPYFIIKETIWLRWPMFQVGEIQKWFHFSSVSLNIFFSPKLA